MAAPEAVAIPGHVFPCCHAASQPKYSHAAFLIHFCAVDFLLNRVVSLATLIWRQQGRRAIHVRHFSPDAEEPKAAFFMHSMCDHVGL